MTISRRAVIAASAVVGAIAGAGGWALLAENRMVPGRSLIDQTLGRCEIPVTATTAEPGRLVTGSFFSRRRGRSVGYVLAYPPKAPALARLPVCLVLHGLGADESTAFDDLDYHRLLAEVGTSGQVGAAGYVLASVAGGDGYWHPHRASGDDPLGMLLEEFPLVLAQHGLLVDRLAAMGWSMGGFGALLAATEAPARFVAVAASAPAFWRSYDEARSVNEDAFDSADEWRQWGDLLARADRLKGMAVRVDCGGADPFAPAVKDLQERLPDPDVVHLAKGCHDNAFFRSVAPAQLQLVAEAFRPGKRT